MACVQMFLQRQSNLKTKLGFSLDIPVYLYASIDIDGIAPVASAVGGIQVTLQDSIPGVGEKGQTILLKGAGSRDIYPRQAHTTGADIGRASKEQDFMMKLAKKDKEHGRRRRGNKTIRPASEICAYNLTTIQMVDFAKILV